MKKLHERAVCWFKRDLRLTDHAALLAALQDAKEVLPVFIEEPSLLAAADTSAMHVSAWREALGEIRQQLRLLEADLYFASGEVVLCLAKLREQWPFTAIYAHEEIGNDRSYARDRAVAAWCQEQAIAYHEYPQSSVRRGGVNRDRFAKLWKTRIEATPPAAAPTRVSQAYATRQLAACTRIPPAKRAEAWQAVSPSAAKLTLESFLADRGKFYSGGISSPNTALHHGSRLSVHLAYGTISAREIWHATQTRLAELTSAEREPGDGRTLWARSLANFTSRLHWRDHFTQRLESEPTLEFQALHPQYRDLPYEDDPALLEAWAAGQTGFPLVDAVMRCLAETGFINFRMRAMVVSFACHALHLSWRTIHNPLARVFRDFEPGIHFNQLQMQAGVVGWNTIRVYSPAKQLEEHDPRAAFTKRWLPELRDLKPERILAHARGEDRLPGYPPPIINFDLRTAAMKTMLFHLRKIADPKITAEVYRRHGSRVNPMTRRRSPAARLAKRAKPKPNPDRPDQLRLF